MFNKKLQKISITLGLSLLFVGALPGLLQAHWATAQTANTSFTFQGRLHYKTNYVNDTCNFDFYLFDAPSRGNQLGAVQSKNNITVNDGYFTVDLDFGDVFAGGVPRYLEVRNINCTQTSVPTNLAGRMQINPVPAAIRAETAGSVVDDIDWANVTNKPLSIADTFDDGLDISCHNDETLRWVGAASGGWECTQSLNDHGSLKGLTDDDHPQYLLADGARTMSGRLNMGNQQIINLSTAITNGQPAVYQQVVKVGDPVSDDLSGAFPNPTVTHVQGYTISSSAPVANQVLTWDVNQWESAESQAGGPAGGDLSGDYPNPRVDKIQNEAVSGVAPLDMQALRYNNSSAQWEPANVLNEDDAADGDLSGKYPNPSTDGLQGRAVSNSNPDTNHVLTWDASAPGGGRWQPEAPQILGPAGGDLSGEFPNPKVVKLQNNPIGDTAPQKKQVLTWDGVQWSPADVSSLQTRDVSDQTPVDTNVLAWNGSQWAPAKVKTLQENPVLDVLPSDKQVLQWKDSQWQPGTVYKPGDALSGDLTGTFPNPSLAEGVATMDEVVIPMGYGDDTAFLTASTVSGTLVTIMPTTANFTPDAPGKCMVFASAFILSEGSGDHNADSDPPPYLRTARQVEGNLAVEDDGSQAMYFSPDDVDKDTPIGISANYVWDISQIDIGKKITFGCSIGDPPNADWGTDERVYCRVAFVCMGSQS